MYEIYTKEKKTFLGIKQKHISYSKLKIMQVTMEFLRKIGDFFLP